jgi:hypothetical protein
MPEVWTGTGRFHDGIALAILNFGCQIGVSQGGANLIGMADVRTDEQIILSITV